MRRLLLPLVLAGLVAAPLPGAAHAAPSAVARLAQADGDLARASVRLAQARSLGDAAAEVEAAAAKARLVGRTAVLAPLADAERRRAADAERRRTREAAQDAADEVRTAAAVSPYAPYTALAASTGPPPSAETLVPLLDGYLASRQSPLTGLAATFVAEGAATGVDPRILVAIAGAETSFGVYGPSQGIRNPFGLGPGMSFGSWEESIAYAARNLAGSLYAGDGRYTIPAIQARWAPNGAANDPTGLNSHWTRNVSTYYTELGGDPAGAVIGLTASAPAPTGELRIPAAVPAAPSPASPARTAAEAALRLVGTTGLDGPGLVRAGWAAAGVALPTSLAGLMAFGEPLAAEDVRAGDAVLLGDEGMGVYLGAGRVAWVAEPGAAVAVASFTDPTVASLYSGARRFGAVTGPAAPNPA